MPIFRNIKTSGKFKHKPTVIVPADPYVANVKSIVNFNNSLTDLVAGNTVDAGGVATYSTTAKFGTHSKSSGQLVSVSKSGDFTLGEGTNYCVETFFYMSAAQPSYSCLIAHNTHGGYGTFILYAIGTQYAINIGSNGGGWLVAAQTIPVSISLNAWHHVAVCREGTTTSVYIDYARAFQYTSASAFNNAANKFYIGSISSYTLSNGYLDSFRATIGHHRYSGTTIPEITTEFTL